LAAVRENGRRMRISWIILIIGCLLLSACKVPKGGASARR